MIHKKSGDVMASVAVDTAAAHSMYILPILSSLPPVNSACEWAFSVLINLVLHLKGEE